MKGTVKWFDDIKGFGFITGEDGKEFFVHNSEIKEDRKTLREGDSVTFEVAEGEAGKGPKAVNVKKE